MPSTVSTSEAAGAGPYSKTEVFSEAKLELELELAKHRRAFALSDRGHGCLEVSID
jgi:hypothetical protein